MNQDVKQILNQVPSSPEQLKALVELAESADMSLEDRCIAYRRLAFLARRQTYLSAIEMVERFGSAAALEMVSASPDDLVEANRNLIHAVIAGATLSDLLDSASPEAWLAHHRKALGGESTSRNAE